MSNEEKGPDPILDRAISEIRNEPVDPAVVSAAADRVWARVSEAAACQPSEDLGTIRTCADFQALIPAWREHRLPSARALLVEDHLHECPACRKALNRRAQPEPIPIRKTVRPVWKWAVAAAMVVAVGLSGYFAYDRFAPAPSGPRATVRSLDGILYQTAAGAYTPLAAGAALEERQTVRTDKGSGALLQLRDGSVVEMRERTELSLSERRDGATIQLAAGSIIVQAAKQRKGHLYVSTADCLVSVTGTVFSVNSGLKGSRVSVIEGEVEVAQGGHTSVLHPGDQVATTAALAAVPVKDEIAWSRNFDRHVALLNEFSKLRTKLEAAPGPGLRYSSKLLPLVPDGAVFYASIPNVGPTLSEANRLFQEQLQQSEVLRQWWTEKMKTPENQAKFDDVLNRIRSFSDYLGQEIVVTLVPTTGGEPQAPLVMAEATRTGLRAFLEQEIAKLKTEPNAHVQIRIVDDPARAVSTGKEALIYLGGGIIAVSNDLAQLRQVAALVAQPGAGAFARSDFHARIAAAYGQGVTWLFCADMQSLAGKAAKADPNLQLSGFGDVRYLIVERRDVAGRAESSADLTFAQPRRSIASWLAAPAPMRVLDYISPDATFAVAALAKNPARMLDDVAAMNPANLASGLAGFEAATGVNLRTELIEPLGGEVAFALDGPLLPQPSWKLVLEVNNPERFAQTLDKLVAAAKGLVRLEKQTAGGRTFYTLTGPKPGLEAHFVFDNGLVVAAPSRDLLVRTLQYRSTGYTLARSPKFTALLPHDGQVNFSAMVYHSLGSLIAPFAAKMQLTPEQRKSLDALAPANAPVLVLAYGEADRIHLASSGSFFGLRLEQMLGMAPGRFR
jgi:ferric-dicitrate binding protein FerR (iron transport regulator)